MACFEVTERDVAVFVSGDGFQRSQTLCKRFCVLGKCGSICAFFPCHIAHVNVDIGQAFSVRALEKVCPRAVDGVAVSGLILIDGQIQNFIQLILLTGNCIFYGDSVCPRRKSHNTHGKYHDQCQQETGKFLCAFHFCNTSFFLYSLRCVSGVASQWNARAPFLRFSVSIELRQAGSKVRPSDRMPMGPFLRSQEAWGRIVLDAQRIRAAPNTRVQVAKVNIIFHRDRILRNCHGYGKLVIHIPIRNLGLRQGV